MMWFYQVFLVVLCVKITTFVTNKNIDYGETTACYLQYS